MAESCWQRLQYMLIILITISQVCTLKKGVLSITCLNLPFLPRRRGNRTFGDGDTRSMASKKRLVPAHTKHVPRLDRIRETKCSIRGWQKNVKKIWHRISLGFAKKAWGDRFGQGTSLQKVKEPHTCSRYRFCAPSSAITWRPKTEVQEGNVHCLGLQKANYFEHQDLKISRDEGSRISAGAFYRDAKIAVRCIV